MTDYQPSAGPDAGQHRDNQPSRGRRARWGDCLRMIAVTAEDLSTAFSSAETSDYVPTVPADSEERRLD